MPSVIAPPPPLPAVCLARLNALMQTGGRQVLGLVGPPGCGKSTLAAALQHAVGEAAQVVPMDGYHLANVELQRLGRAGRKGAADTFDTAGYAALLQRLRQQAEDEVVYAPEFRREIEEPVAGAIPVYAGTRLVVTEGNYLLLREGAWAAVAGWLDEVWYVDADDALRNQRLIGRHQRFGRSRAEAEAWVAATDAPNARLIEATRARADWIFSWDAVE